MLTAGYGIRSASTATSERMIVLSVLFDVVKKILDYTDPKSTN
jgi:hypothetical protein